MALCGVCGKNSILPERYDSLVLCKKCALKIRSPKWKSKVFTTNDEVDAERDSVEKMALRSGFPETALEALRRYFDDKKMDGLVKLFDGRAGQTLAIFEDYCVIDTQEDFDYEEIDKAYRQMMTPSLRGKRFVESIEKGPGIDGEMLAGAAKDIVSGLAFGGSLGKSVIKAGAGIASSVANKSKDDEGINLANVELRIEYGLTTLKYSDCEDVYLRLPLGEEEYGFVRFQRGRGADSAKDKLFFFDDSESSKRTMKELQSYMQRKISALVSLREQKERDLEESARSRAAEIEAAKDSLFLEALKSSSPQMHVSAPDELLKWKQLLDAGAISQSEYDGKKAQLLGM